MTRAPCHNAAMVRTAPRLVLALLTTLPLAACGGGAKPPISSTPAATAPITPDPAPTTGPAPADVLDALAGNGSNDRICFGWAPSGDVICAVESSSIQGGATMSVRVLGPHAADFPYYRSPEDEQFFDVDPAAIDRAALDRAKAAAAALGLQGWGGPDAELPPDATVVVGNHTLRRIRIETGTDGDPESGVWATSKDTVELRCDERWVPVPLEGDVFGHPVEPPDTAVVALGPVVLITARVSWGIEGDHGGGADAALIDPATICR